MANQLIVEGNFDRNIHTLRDWCDAFGNLVEPPEGYYLLTGSDKILMNDIHFDIYTGWTTGGEEYHVSRDYYVRSEGRWRAWARKINNENNRIMTNDEIKKEVEICYSQISDANGRLADIRSLCKHEQTKVVDYLFREGKILPATVCSYCGELLHINHINQESTCTP